MNKKTYMRPQMETVRLHVGLAFLTGSQRLEIDHTEQVVGGCSNKQSQYTIWNYQEKYDLE